MAEPEHKTLDEFRKWLLEPEDAMSDTQRKLEKTKQAYIEEALEKLNNVRAEVEIIREQRYRGRTRLCLHVDTESDLDSVIDFVHSLLADEKGVSV